jgi:formiminoglutamase/agmatinase
VSRRFDLWGVPFDGGATLGWPGARYAPRQIRQALEWMWMRVQDGRIYDVDGERLLEVPDELLVDRGDVEVVPHDLMATLEACSEAVSRSVRDGRVPIVLGGEDSLFYPVVRGVHDAVAGSVAVVHFDAHFDLLDESPRQGRFSHSSGMRRSLELERVDPSASIQVGVRHFNFASSRRFAESAGLEQVSARRFHELGAAAVAARVLERVEAADHVVWSFDIDVVDPAHAPGAGAHEPGGITSAQAIECVRAIAPRCDAFAVMEVNPMKDLGDMTSTLAAYLVFHFAIAAGVVA